MSDLAAQLPADAMIFDEALTSSPDLVRYLPPRLAGHFFQQCQFTTRRFARLEIVGV